MTDTFYAAFLGVLAAYFALLFFNFVFAFAKALWVHPKGIPVARLVFTHCYNCHAKLPEPVLAAPPQIAENGDQILHTGEPCEDCRRAPLERPR